MFVTLVFNLNLSYLNYLNYLVNLQLITFSKKIVLFISQNCTKNKKKSNNYIYIYIYIYIIYLFIIIYYYFFAANVI